MRRVLFVDDEPKVLDGLRRMLYPMRSEWEMAFVGSAREALHKLAACPFDVLVTDIRMPEMDGAELLEHVSQQYPQIVRIVLSSQTDDETSMRVVDVAHQCLAKPCDPAILKRSLNRSCALRDIVADPAIQGLLTRIDHLPSMPGPLAELVREIRSPQASFRRVAAIITKDAGMTAKILQLVNSAFFGLRYKVTSLDQAITLLGLKTVRSLAMSLQVFSQFDSFKVKEFSLDGIMNHCVATGSFAKRIAIAEGRKEDADEAFMAGLLHDTGRLILLDRMSDAYSKVLQSVREQEIPLVQAEKDALGVTHAEVGTYLLGLWGLPEATLEAVAYHHRPEDCPQQEFSCLTAVHVANALDHEGNVNGPDATAPRLSPAYLETAGLTERLPAWRKACEFKKDADDD